MILADYIQDLKKKVSDESGLTLTEFLLVSFFFVFVVILVFQIVYFTRENSKIAERFSVMSSEVGVPLDIMDRYLSQNTKLVSATPYRVVVNVPQKNASGGPTGVTYTVTMWVDTTGKVYVKRSLFEDTLAIAEGNVNVSKNAPMFSLRDIDNQPTTEVTDAYSVVVRIVASIPGSDKTVESSRTVLFRNR